MRKKFPDDMPGHPAAGGFEVQVSNEVTSPFLPWAVAERHRVTVKDARSGEAVLTLEAWMSYLGAVTLSPGGKQLGLGWNDTTILIFDVPGKK